MSDDLLRVIRRSINELRWHGREPVLIRIHPMDIEALRARYTPEADPSKWEDSTIFGIPIVGDETRPRGEPVAEWNPRP